MHNLFKGCNNNPRTLGLLEAVYNSISYSVQANISAAARKIVHFLS